VAHDFNARAIIDSETERFTEEPIHEYLVQCRFHSSHVEHTLYINEYWCLSFSPAALSSNIISTLLIRKRGLDDFLKSQFKTIYEPVRWLSQKSSY